jgi:hypothetical protein
MAAQTCTKCGKAMAPGSAFCTQCGTKAVPSPVAAAPAAPPAGSSPSGPPSPPPNPPLPSTPVAPTVRPRTCVNCKSQMAGIGQVSFRTGGYVGGAGILAGSWNAAAENLQPFSLYYCQQCGKFDLYYAGT